MSKIMGIDPGKSKCGIAVIDSELAVYIREIVTTVELTERIKDIYRDYNIQVVVIGNGTYSDLIGEKIRGLDNQKSLVYVDEANTTRKAENRYRKENYSRFHYWLSRLIHWKPHRPVDDYAALCLAERYIKDL